MKDARCGGMYGGGEGQEPRECSRLPPRRAGAEGRVPSRQSQEEIEPDVTYGSDGASNGTPKEPQTPPKETHDSVNVYKYLSL